MRGNSDDGGGGRDRTDDLKLAKLPLSQLSYAPPITGYRMVGLGRLELPTSRLSGVRSNHLSYRPFSLAIRRNPQMANNTGDLPMRGPKGSVPEAHPIERETKTATSRFVNVTAD